MRPFTFPQLRNLLDKHFFHDLLRFDLAVFTTDQPCGFRGQSGIYLSVTRFTGIPRSMVFLP